MAQRPVDHPGPFAPGRSYAYADKAPGTQSRAPGPANFSQGQPSTPGTGPPKPQDIGSPLQHDENSYGYAQISRRYDTGQTPSPSPRQSHLAT